MFLKFQLLRRSISTKINALVLYRANKSLMIHPDAEFLKFQEEYKKFEIEEDRKKEEEDFLKFQEDEAEEDRKKEDEDFLKFQEEYDHFEAEEDRKKKEEEKFQKDFEMLLESEAKEESMQIDFWYNSSLEEKKRYAKDYKSNKSFDLTGKRNRR